MKLSAMRKIEILAWFILGIVVLTQKNTDVSYMKFEYFMVWVCFLVNLVLRVWGKDE